MILGAGPVGVTLLERLVERGEAVRLVTRKRDVSVPPGVEHMTADVAQLDEARRACAGAAVVFGCVGVGYPDWLERWPPLMEGMLAGAEAAGARFVFMDNLYMYGPVSGPLHEALPLTNYGVKPALRAHLTRVWHAAHTSGSVQAVALRASDFYGPHVTRSMLGEQVFGRAMTGRSAFLVGDSDQPHSVSYVPDVVRALITLADAPEAAMGQAWHVPNAPTVTVRELVSLIYRELVLKPRLIALPESLMWAAGLFNADLREVREMMYEWTAPHVVDHTKFGQAFWSDPTPLDVGIRATLDWYRGRTRASSP